MLIFRVNPIFFNLLEDLSLIFLALMGPKLTPLILGTTDMSIIIGPTKRPLITLCLKEKRTTAPTYFYSPVCQKKKLIGSGTEVFVASALEAVFIGSTNLLSLFDSTKITISLVQTHFIGQLRDIP